MLERDYQKKLITKLKKTFPGAMILKNDSGYIQGIPDLLILHKDKWAALEVKQNAAASHRPNQDFYIEKLKGMSYAAFISPDNEREIINEIQRTFETCR